MRLFARLVAVGLLALSLSGCGGGGDDGTAPEPPSFDRTDTGAGATTATPPAERSAALYYLRGEKLGVARRELARTEGVGAAALRALLEGPTAEERAAGLSSAIPAGTTLLGLSIADNVATVDLSKEFEAGGGSASMQARVAQVVHTLTQFPTVGSVRFHIDGEPVESIGGEGVLVDPPVDRNDFEDLSPAILLESPAAGEEVQSPVRLRGTANTFEATFMVEILGGDGRKLAEDFVTATSGSGERGTFDATFEFDVAEAGPGTIVVLERSAEDGSRIHEVRIPVRLAPS